MFGKGILKIIGLAIAGAMALAGGAQLLSSVALVVIAFRVGDIVPLVLVIGTTFSLIQLKRILGDRTLSAIVGILAYAASGYLSVIAFVGLLPYGMLSSLVGATLTIMVCSVMYDPSQLNEWLATLSADSPASWLSRSVSPSELLPNLEVSHQLILLPPNSLNLIARLMKNRPLLPISLTHYNECDILFIDATSKRTTPAQVREILVKANVALGNEVTPLLREAILKVPLIDEQNGLPMSDYCLATEHDTVVQLMSNAPSRMIVFPSKSGPRIIYPESAAPGLVSQKVPENELVNALLLHRYAGFEEVHDTYANAT